MCNTFRVPSDMLHISSKTQKLFSQDYDRHGDSYYDDTNEEKLKDVFKAIGQAVSKSNT